jgi:Copper amine oxidase N-terminal domain.
MKSYRILASLLVLFCLAGQPAFAQSDYGIVINSKAETFERMPVKRNGSILVPFRAIFTALGAEVKYEKSDKSISGTKGDTTVRLQLGSTTAWKNNEKLTLAQPPVLIEGSAYVPIRFVSESLGAEVEWDSANKTVRIQTIGSHAALPAKELLPVANDEGKAVYLLHNGDYRLKWSYEDESPYQMFDVSAGPDGTVIVHGFGDELLVMDKEGSILKHKSGYGKGYQSIEAVKITAEQGSSYQVRVKEDGETKVWQDIPVKENWDSDPLAAILKRITATTDRHGNLVVLTTEGLASYAQDGRRLWVVKEWAFGDTKLKAGDILEVDIDGRDQIYLFFDGALVLTDLNGQVLATVEHDIGIPEVEESGLLLSGGGSYRVENGSLIPVGEAPVRDAYPLYRTDGAQSLFRYSDDGELLWTYRLNYKERAKGFSFFEYNYDGNFVRDEQDNVYISTTSGSVHALDRDGNPLFTVLIDNFIISSAQILPLSPNEIVIAEGSRVLFLEKIQP